MGHPANTYFKDKLLCAFDALLLASADMFLEGDLRVLAEAKHYEIPVALVRTKADVHIENIMHVDELEAEAAEKYAAYLRCFALACGVLLQDT